MTIAERHTAENVADLRARIDAVLGYLDGRWTTTPGCTSSEPTQVIRALLTHQASVTPPEPSVS